MKQSPSRAENGQTVFQAALARLGGLITRGMRQGSAESKELSTTRGNNLGFIFASSMPGSLVPFSL